MEGITSPGLQKECLALTLAVLVCVLAPSCHPSEVPWGTSAESLVFKCLEPI